MSSLGHKEELVKGEVVSEEPRGTGQRQLRVESREKATGKVHLGAGGGAPSAPGVVSQPPTHKALYARQPPCPGEAQVPRSENAEAHR